MMPTIFPFGRYIFMPFKPKGYKDEYNKLSPEQIGVMDKVDHIVGWTIVIGVVLLLGVTLTFS
jgi:hypothetical protein